MKTRTLRLLLATVLFSAVLVSATPTCQLTGLTLTDTSSGVALNIHDSNGAAFSAGKYRYYCSCGSSIDAVTVTVQSDEDDVTYDMSFEDATRTVQSQQYLARGAPSNQMRFTLTPSAYPSYSNTIIVTPSSSSCQQQYTVTCTKKPPTTSVSGDPQFVGLRGQSYQVHGVAGEVYSIISDPALQMNSRFVFLNKGDCPTLPSGVKQQNCFAHEGSYLGEIGLKTASGDKIHIMSGPAAKGFKSILVNGEAMKVGQVTALPGGNSVSLNHTHLATVSIGNFHLEFESSDMFVNQRVKVLDWSSLASHGLLGQTWRAKTYANAVKHIEGVVDDYVVAGKDLFGDKFMFNQYGLNADATTTTAETTTTNETKDVADSSEEDVKQIDLQQDDAPRSVEALAVHAAPAKTMQGKLRKTRGVRARKIGKAAK